MTRRGLVDTLRQLGPGGIGGLLLLIATAVAIAWANSSFGSVYESILGTPFSVGLGRWVLSKPLLLWINDGLMALFFLLVGLEIKRELLDGTLSSPRRAALPAFAALGGMVGPALIYLVLTAGTEGARGWAIPAATDIAFALGILALLGRRVPIELKVFLTALAVIDDLGAVLIIALFYSGELATGPLLAAAAALAGLIGLSRGKVLHPLPYALLGALLWLFVLKSGVHATVAGVLLAMTIPARGLVSPESFELFGRRAFGLAEHEDPDEFAPATRVHSMRELCNRTEPMLLRWEHALQPWVLFGVMPVFAFANAGVVLGGGAEGSLITPVSAGVFFGLLLGKPLGVTLFSWIAVRAGLAAPPEGFSWRQLHAAGWLAGIGFTMSLFVTSLAVDDPALALAAKGGLLAASALAGVIGSVLLVLAARQNGTVVDR